MFVPSDPNWRERCLGSFARQPMMETLGVEVCAIDPGVVVLAFGHDDRLTQQHGLVHAGALGTVLDSACGWAALSLMPADRAVLTVEYKLDLLRPADGERFEGTGRVLKPGRTLTVAEGVVVDPSAPDRPIATMTATLMGSPIAGSRSDRSRLSASSCRTPSVVSTTLRSPGPASPGSRSPNLEGSVLSTVPGRVTRRDFRL